MDIKRIGQSVILVLSVVFLFQNSTDSKHPMATQASVAAPQIQNFDQLPLYFIENNGQLDGQVEYHLKMPGSNVLFTRDSIDYQFISKASNNNPGRFPARTSESEANQQVVIDSLRVRFNGTSERVELIGLKEHIAKFNFYQGSRPSTWVEGARSFNKVKYKNLYPQIDMIVFKSKGFLKQEYRIRKGGAVADICAVYEHAKDIRVNEKGQLEIHTASGVLLEDTPISYQIIDGRKVFVATEYMVEEGNRVCFKTGDYDQEHTLVIDPSLVYSTFLGGSGSDRAGGIAIDLHLNAYVVGTTSSTDFVTTIGSPIYRGGENDMFIAKLDSTGSQLLFSTYFGGSGFDAAQDIAFSWDDESAVVVGYTWSHDIPTTQGAYDRTQNGGADIILAKFSSTGTLKFSTYLGGEDEEYSGYKVSLDGYGNIFVIGGTRSPNFPTTPGVFDDDYDDFHSGKPFIAKFNKNLSGLLYSTFFGGPHVNLVGISVDYAGNAFITGNENRFLRSNIPTTPGAYDTDGSDGTSDGFVASLNPTGTALNYCTFLGDIDSVVNDRSVSGISVDEGEAFVIGTDTFHDGGSSNGFVMGFDASGGKKLFQYTTLRRAWGEKSYARAIAVDGRGAAYVVFSTNFPDLPTSDDAFQASLKGLFDYYIVKLKTTNGRVLYSTYMGGSRYESGIDLVVDSFGSAYVTGYTESPDFPTTAGAYSTESKGGDAFIARIRDSGPAGQLHLNKSKQAFKIPYENTDTFKKNFTIQNTGAGVVNYDISTSPDWLTVNPNSGDVRNEKDNVDVYVTAEKLKPGRHQGIVKVSSVDAFNSPQQLLVNLKVNGPTIRIKRKKYSLGATEGSTTPIIKKNKIKNKGPGELRYKLKSPESWIKVMPKQGTSTGEWDDFTFEVDPTGLAAGIYQGIIQVISKDTVDTAEITVYLNLKAPDNIE